eukprot:Nk52_evm5s274 gene=Nk52_evmTU5s274
MKTKGRRAGMSHMKPQTSTRSKALCGSVEILKQRNSDSVKSHGDAKLELSCFRQIGWYMKLTYGRLSQLSTQAKEKMQCIILFAVAFGLRVWNIKDPHFCIFDEEHFGFDTEQTKHNRMSPHWESINDDYLTSPNFAYIPLRLTCAFFGACTVPLFFLILKVLRYDNITVLFGTLLFLFENSFVTFSRIIVLDSMLWCFTLCTLLSLMRVIVIEDAFFSQGESKMCKHVVNSYEETTEWRLSLAATGIFMGLTAGVKLCGLFTVALVGLHTIVNLHKLVANRRVTMLCILKIFVFKVIVLVVIPVVILSTLYYIHLTVLPSSGRSDYLMSVPFQSSVQGNFYHHRRFSKMPLHVVHGSSIRLVLDDQFTVSTMQGNQRYPLRHPHGGESSGEIMVSLTDVPKNAQLWTILLADEGAKCKEKRDFICNGSFVILKSEQSNCYLRISGLGSIMTLHQMEVSCGEVPSSVWEVVFPYEPSLNCSPLLTESTEFFLKEVTSRRSLASLNIPLPKWAQDQYELFASWDVTHYSHRLRVAENYMERQLLKERQSSFPPVDKPKMRVAGTLSRIWELFLKSFKVNNKFVVGHPFMSSPVSWPLLTRGILLFEERPYLKLGSMYLLGNAVIWFTSDVALIGISILYFTIAIRRLRGFEDLSELSRLRLYYIFWVGVIGWALHFLPYIFLNRTTFLHHYLTALIFKILCLVGFVDIFCGEIAMLVMPIRIRSVGDIKCIFFGCLSVASICFFVYFLPLIYAWPLENYEKDMRNWFSGWGIGSED